MQRNLTKKSLNFVQPICEFATCLCYPAIATTPML